MGETVGTTQGKIKEKASEETKFRLTPRLAYLEKKMVEAMQIRSRSHDKTSAYHWLIEHWDSLERAQRFLELRARAAGLEKESEQILLPECP